VGLQAKGSSRKKQQSGKGPQLEATFVTKEKLGKVGKKRTARKETAAAGYRIKVK